LCSLTSIRSDFKHRILIGHRRTGGHGVGKINELGADIAMEDGDKVIDALRSTAHFYETDAFLLIAGVAGGTGSGSMPIIAKVLKDRFKDKPVYTIVALPFEHEEKMDARTIYNTATSLKAIYSVADAVFVVDNQRYVEKDRSLLHNMTVINKLIAEPFYELLCAGEEKKAKHIGARLLDAGDISQTLGGWSVLGYGESQLPIFELPNFLKRNFRKKSTETHNGIQAMTQAISNLSLQCNPSDSTSALYLLSAPANEMNMDSVKELGDYLSELAPHAIIRYGDYPHGGRMLTVTVILSRLNYIEKVKEYYKRTPDLIQQGETAQKQSAVKIEELLNASTEVPSLM